MKIKILDWSKFEKQNSIYFTRDINIIDEEELFATDCENYKKGKKYFLVYIDFAKYDIFSWIKEGDYFQIVDDSFDREYIILNSYVSQYHDIDGIVELHMRDIVAKKWMIESN